MAYRTDKFQVGDKVKFDRDFIVFGGLPNHLLSNDGIFTIDTIQNLPLNIDPLTNESNLDGVGHTQWVTVKEAPKEKFSGAWFVKVQTQEFIMRSVAYAGYRGRSIGRVMHFLCSINYEFDTMAKFGRFNSETGERTIEYGYGNGDTSPPTLAKYTWIGDTDVPLIIFEEDFKKYQAVYYMVMVDIIAHDVKYGTGIWSQCQHEQDVAAKDARKKQFFNSIMKGDL